MRRRLIAAIAAVAAASLIVLAVPLALVLRTDYRNAELLRLQRDTVAATRAIDLGRGADPIELPEGNDVTAVYNARFRRVAGTGPPTAPPDARRAFARRGPQATQAGGVLVASVPLLSGERVVGVVRAVRNDNAASSAAHRAWLVLTALSLAITLGAVLAAVALGRSLSRPLERLARGAGAIGREGSTVTLERSGIDEVDEVAQALEEGARELHRTAMRERSFAADASHQLRTPLQAMRIELESAALRGADLPEIAATLVQVERLEATISTLLSVARDQRGPAQVADVSKAIAEAARRWREPLSAAGRALRVEDDLQKRSAEAADELWVEGRPDAQPGVADANVALGSSRVIAEILDVLIDNTLRHGLGDVVVASRHVGGAVAIEVSDEGGGFADGVDPFRRRGAEAAGHGIGLALARSLAEADGATLEIARASPCPVLRLRMGPAAESQGQSPAAPQPNEAG